MRILLDLQGCQTSGSRTRGIGRYSLALASAMARQAGKHEVWLALNGRFEESVPDIRAAFRDWIPAEHIRVFDIPAGVAELDPANGWRTRAAERVREHFLGTLKPDIVHVSSLFEGFGDDSVASAGLLEPADRCAVTLFDLIPLLNPDLYLGGERVRNWYYRKLQSLRNAGLLLAISEHSRSEAISALSLPEDRVVNMSSAADARFRRIALPPDQQDALRQRYGLSRRIVMYTGGIDHRKNIEGLIEAYARLPKTLRADHQLAIVCSVGEQDRIRIRKLAQSHGLVADEIILTGFVPDDDLVLLYNLATLFVFPSKHEGFGLPALEAMACGAPTIGANRSSIPEVIGRSDALFDPFDIASITDKIATTLNDNDFRRQLAEHGLVQAKRFSWDASAQRAIEAMESQHARLGSADRNAGPASGRQRPRLAYLSPLPPEKSGIADYSLDLLPELARHYDIEIITDQADVSAPWASANFPIRSTTWFDTHARRYDRIVYHFGNSAFHSHMFDLLDRHPGVVVLHDFFFSNLLDHLDTTGAMPGALDRALYRSHGYPALGLLKREGREAAVWAFPCNRDILDRAAGLIVHSRFPQTLAERFYGDDSSDAERWALIPLLRPFRKEVSRAEARRRLGLDEQDFIVCSFGMLGPIKLNDRLLSAWLGSTLAADTRCRLVFVGHNPPGDYGRRLSLAIEAGPAASRISITGFASPEQYALWLAAADLSVQLRTRTRGETSAAILDCLSYGLPLVFNAHGAAADIPDMLGVKLSDEADEDEIRGALERLREHPSLRNRLSQAAIRYMTAHHAPAHVGTLYRDAIERFAVSHPGAREQRLLESLSNMVAPVPPTDDDLAALAACVAGNRPAPARRTLFLDVSELARRDSASGIQRVVKSLMRVMVLRPLNDIRVEPVYEREGRFHHARALTCRLLGLSALPLPDDLVEFAPGNLFLGLDFVPDRVPAMKSTFQALRARGVGVHFVVYDLLPLLRPDWHPQGTDEAFFRPWLETVAQTADSLVCISRAVADDLAAWLAQQPPARADEVRIGFFHLGADISDERPAGSVPPSHQAVLEAAGRRPTFLMVGTVEPRKGYAQALAAFEQIWRDGTDANLVIVGKQGWMVEALVDRLRGNVEANRRLFWVTDAGDDVLLRLYEQSSALLAASEGEGFGLPLVEASKHALPIIARDIPPFREVAGRHAWYFSGLEADELAEALGAWLRLDEAGKAPQSADMPWLSWEQSADQLLDAVLGSVRLRASLTADG